MLHPGQGFGASKVKVQALLDPSFWSWGIRFLISSFPTQTTINGRHIRELSFYSMKTLRKLQGALGDSIHMDETARGTFEIFFSKRDFQVATDSDRKIHVEDSSFPLHEIPAYKASEMLNGAINPELFKSGVLFSPSGTNGDVYKMSIALYKECMALGVQFKLQTEIKEIEIRDNRFASVITSTGEKISGDAAVLALGAATPKVASTAGVSLPIIPVKGYVIDAPISNDFITRMKLNFNIYAVLRAG